MDKVILIPFLQDLCLRFTVSEPWNFEILKSLGTEDISSQCSAEVIMEAKKVMKQIEEDING